MSPIPENQTLVIPTFDDGPVGAEWHAPGMRPGDPVALLDSLDLILDALDRRALRAVFYVAYSPRGDGAGELCDGWHEKWLEGVRRIDGAGHVVALHAYNHRLYGSFFLSPEDAVEDLERLCEKLDEADVPWRKVWRVPYGGMRTLMWERLCVAPRAGIESYHTWSIDSGDWENHYDGPSPDMTPEQWWDNITGDLRRGVIWSGGRGRPWADILMHVNPDTAGRLDEMLDRIEEYYRRYYNDDWGPDGEFYWLGPESTDGPQFRDYLGGRGI